MKTCKYCGKVITNPQNYIFCNRECYRLTQIGIPLSKEKNEKARLANIGNQYTKGRKTPQEETDRRMATKIKNGSFRGPPKGTHPIGEFKKGMIPWNKGLTRSTDIRINNIVYKPRFFIAVKNKLEEDFEYILEENFPNKWIYAGTGSMPIGYKFPDFINEKEKKIIEVFGNYWHRNDTGEDRTILFKQYGYSTLIIWEREIREDLLNVLEKVSNF